jgi:tetrapyrrole methylase family protein/MazG family protein
MRCRGIRWWQRRACACCWSAARAQGVAVQVVGSSSFLEPTLEALGLCITDGVQVIDALSATRFPPEQWMHVLYYQVYDRFVVSDLKLLLMRYYPEEHPVDVVRAAGVPGQQQVETVPLYQLDRVPVDHLTSVHVPPLAPRQPTRFRRAGACGGETARSRRMSLGQRADARDFAPVSAGGGV